MNWESLRTAKAAEIEQLASMSLSEVTPSIRSFVQYVTTHKQELAFIAAIKRIDPHTGRRWEETDLVAFAQACDDAEVGAIAVYTEPCVFGTSLEDLQKISGAVTAPILRLDLVMHVHQIHQARLCGADAVLLWAGILDATTHAATLANLVTVATSAHVTPVVAVRTEAEVEQALTAGAFVLGITSPSGKSGKIDMAQIERLSPLIPRQKTVLALDEAATADECAALQGKVDAVLVGNMLLDAPAVEAVLARLASLTG
jgi:indole-3-glycerol phosphate synthase